MGTTFFLGEGVLAERGCCGRHLLFRTGESSSSMTMMREASWLLRQLEGLGFRLERIGDVGCFVMAGVLWLSTPTLAWLSNSFGIIAAAVAMFGLVAAAEAIEGVAAAMPSAKTVDGHVWFRDWSLTLQPATLDLKESCKTDLRQEHGCVTLRKLWQGHEDL